VNRLVYRIFRHGAVPDPLSRELLASQVVAFDPACFRGSGARSGVVTRIGGGLCAGPTRTANSTSCRAAIDVLMSSVITLLAGVATRTKANGR